MKRMILTFLVLLLVFTSSCDSGEKTVHMETVTCFMDEITEEDMKARSMQRKIASWYNLNLQIEDPDPEFKQAYDSILYYRGGVMGYVLFPEQELRIPIGHGYKENWFSHEPNSSFPVGGEGNHAVLCTDVAMELKQGDRFCIYILGDTLVYCVGEAGEDRCTLVCGENRYDAARVVED